MKKRKLGNSGLEVSAIGFGCMGLNFLDGKGLDNKDAITILELESANGSISVRS
jgi:aryl-alcohol dehydrogenase-like predicted oxidoreductase